MREEETMTIFSDFDDLFGLTKVFSRSHQVFNTCTFYLADGSMTPSFNANGEMLIESGIWRDHLGGVEGMRQKGWTIFTVVILKILSDTLNVKSQLMGQGDNRVLINRYYPRPGMTIKDQHDNFMKQLEVFLSSIGPPLKVEESWTSSKFFTYGKVPIYQGVPLPMSLKKICRMHRLNNDGVTNLDGALSSISANASSAVAMCNFPIIPYFLAVKESIGAMHLYLERSFYGEPLISSIRSSIKMRIPNKGQSIKITEIISSYLSDLLSSRKRYKLMQILTLFPSALGGYPSVQISDLIMRGFPDPVTAAIWELKLVISSNMDPVTKDSVSRMLNPRLSPFVNPELLRQDSTCLNLLRGSRPKDKIRRFEIEFLVAFPGVRNQEFKEFLELATLDQQPLAAALFPAEPCHPRVMSEIFNSTMAGRAGHCIRKVDKTPVLLNLMCKKHYMTQRLMQSELPDDYGWEEFDLRVRAPKALGMLFYEFERNQVSGLLLNLNRDQIDDTLTECSCARARERRIQSWGKPLHGVNVAFPHELLKKDDNDQNPIGGQILVSHDNNPDYWLDILAQGSFAPYLGSTSKEKVDYRGKKLVPVAPPVLSNAIRALRFVNWGTLDTSNLSKLIYGIFGQFPDVDPVILTPKIGMVSGTLEHRVADMRTSHSGSLAIPYIISTHVSVNTNRFRPGSIPGMEEYGNYNINFQAMLSYIAGETVFAGSLGVDPPRVTKMVINCKDCVMGVNEDLLEIQERNILEKALESEALTKRSAFMWINQEDINTLTRRADIGIEFREKTDVDASEDQDPMV